MANMFLHLSYFKKFKAIKINYLNESIIVSGIILAISCSDYSLFRHICTRLLLWLIAASWHLSITSKNQQHAGLLLQHQTQQKMTR